MEIIINDEIAFDKPFISDIIDISKEHEDIPMITFTSGHSILLYSVIKESDYAKLAKKEKTKDPIIFYEYPMQSRKKEFCIIRAEVDLTNMLDMLKPGIQKEISNYEKQCYSNNMNFDTDKDLIEMYMKTNKLNLIRSVNTHDTYMRTSYCIQYKTYDIKCIKRLELITK